MRTLLAFSSVMAFVLAGVTAGGARADPGGDWVMYMHDNGHTGFNSTETAITSETVRSLQQVWLVYQDQNTISAQPTVANGRVYWGTWDGYEHSTDASTGTEIWKTYLGDETKTDCSPPHVGVASTATIATVTIGGRQKLADFVGGGDGSYYALDADSGAVIWSHNFGSPQDGYFAWTSPTVFGDSVYVGVASIGDCPLVHGQLVKLDAATGATQATFDSVPSGCIGGGIWSSPTIDAATGYLYTTTGTGGDCGSPELLSQAFLELRASDLSLVASWKPPPQEQVEDGDFGASPTLFTATVDGQARQLVGAVNKNSIYYAFDRGNVGAGPVWRSGQISTDPSTIASSAWDGNRLYVGGYDAVVGGQSCSGVMRAIDPSTGAFVWSDCFQSGEVTEGLTAVPGVVLAGVGADLVAVDSGTGSVLFDYTDHSGWWFYAPPTVSNGVVYAGSSNGKLYAFKPAIAAPTVAAAPAASASAGNATVHLSWTAPGDGGSPITGYRVYRATSSGGETFLASVGSALSFDDDGVTNGQTYFYWVSAVNGVGEGAKSNEVSAKPQGSPPNPPTNLSAAPAKNRGVLLAWTAPTGTRATSYDVFRAAATATTCGTSFSKIAATAFTSYKDTSTTRGSRYCYHVTAVNSSGESSPSNTAGPVFTAQRPFR